MALTATDRGTVVGDKSSTSFRISPSSNFTAGTVAVLSITIDNSGTGGADPYLSISDTNSNTWSSRVSSLRDPGASNEGVAVRLFDTNQLGGQITTGTVITVSLTDGTVAKTAVLWELSGSTGTPTYESGGSANGTSTSPSVTTTSIPSGDAIIGVVGVEGITTVTEDTDTSDGVWSSQQTEATTTLSTTENMRIASQTKVVTGTATQTYNPTLSASRDWAILWAQYTEVTTSLSPTRSLSIPPAIICM